MILLIISLISVAAHADFLAEEAVPESVRALRAAVLRVAVVETTPVHEVPAADYERWITHARRELGPGGEIAARVIEACQAQSRALCPIYYSVFGSAFLANRGNTLVTSLHWLPKSLRTASAYTPIRIRIFNQSHELLFDAAPGDSVRVTDSAELIELGDRWVVPVVVGAAPAELGPGRVVPRRGETPRSATEREAMERASRDYAVIRLSRVLADIPVLPIGPAPAEGQVFFGLGYPQSRPTIEVISGKWTGGAEGAFTFGAQAPSGMSGGPIVSDRGEVQGLISAGLSWGVVEDGKVKPRYGVLSTRIPALE